MSLSNGGIGCTWSRKKISKVIAKEKLKNKVKNSPRLNGWYKFNRSAKLGAFHSSMIFRFLIVKNWWEKENPQIKKYIFISSILL